MAPHTPAGAIVSPDFVRVRYVPPLELDAQLAEQAEDAQTVLRALAEVSKRRGPVSGTSRDVLSWMPAGTSGPVVAYRLGLLRTHGLARSMGEGNGRRWSVTSASREAVVACV